MCSSDLLQKAGMPTGVCPEQWILENPESLLQLQREFVAAGTQILYAPTFTGNRLKLAGYGLEAELTHINQELDGKALVAGDMTMTGEQLYPIGDLLFEELVDVYKEQAKALYEAGVDLFIVETMMSLQETRAAVLAIRETCDLPVMASLTFGEEGRTLFGNTPEAAAVVLQSLGADAVGMNCSTGPEGMRKNLERMVSYAAVPVLAKPNAGLPVMVDGEVSYPTTPEAFAAAGKQLAEAGASLLGGCCGTTPDHIRQLAEAVRELPEEEKNIPSRRAVRRGLSSERTVLPVGDTELPGIGEAIDVDTDGDLREELSSGEVDSVTDLAMDQEDEEAAILNIHIEAEDIDEKQMMQAIVEELGQTTECPLCFDSSDPEVIEAGLRVYCGKALVNSVSGKDESLRSVLPLCRKYGAAVVGLCLDEQGIPDTWQGRVAIAQRIVEAAESYGIPRHDVYID